MTEQRKRGRPVADDTGALEAIMKNEDTRKEFEDAITNLVYHKREIAAKMEMYSEDVSAVSEKYGLSKGVLNAKVTAIVKDKVVEATERANCVLEILTEIGGE